MSPKKNNPVLSTLNIKAYLPSEEHSPEELIRFNALLDTHPRDRKYLSHKEYTQAFKPNNLRANQYSTLAKINNWKFTQVKKTRELNIQIEYNNDIESTELKGLQYLSTKGDLHLEFDKISVHNSTSDLCKGYIKNNSEFRVGSRESIPIKEAIHGHSTIEIAEAYNFPEGNGEGQTIGIIELGGTFDKDDLEQYYKQYHLDTPLIQVVGKPKNTDLKNNTEVTADIQVIGSLVPKAKLVIYYGDTILEAMKSALNDSKNTLSVISISWAGSELDYSQAELNALNDVFYEASLKGITVIAASGDNGALNSKSYPNVNVPTNFSFVLGCGGTQLEMNNNTISAETVWNESNQSMQIGTGGGFSQRVALTAYQQEAVGQYLNQHPQYLIYNKQNGRGIPDVSANAADSSGYSLFVNGQWVKIGGTSLATPLWAALIARLNQSLGYQLGFINTHLYKLRGSKAFHPITTGNNNLYTGALLWNPCTGLGTPNGCELKEALDTLK